MEPRHRHFAARHRSSHADRVRKQAARSVGAACFFKRGPGKPALCPCRKAAERRACFARLLPFLQKYLREPDKNEKAAEQPAKKLHLPQTAFDILMFLANNPNYTTARDIVEVRHIKANLVSVNVDKLVQEGFLERRPVPGDRRKTELACTEKAQSIIEQGRRMQDDFIRRLMAGLEEEKLEIFFEVIDTMNENLDAILEGEE